MSPGGLWECAFLVVAMASIIFNVTVVESACIMYLDMRSCAYMHACMYVCMYACMYVCSCFCMYTRLYASLSIYPLACMYTCSMFMCLMALPSTHYPHTIYNNIHYVRYDMKDHGVPSTQILGWFFILSKDVSLQMNTYSISSKKHRPASQQYVRLKTTAIFEYLVLLRIRFSHNMKNPRHTKYVDTYTSTDTRR